MRANEAARERDLYGAAIDDVRLLRQRGYVVVREGQGFRVGNQACTLAAMRAKAARERRLIEAAGLQAGPDLTLTRPSGRNTSRPAQVRIERHRPLVPVPMEVPRLLPMNPANYCFTQRGLSVDGERIPALQGHAAAPRSCRQRSYHPTSPTTIPLPREHGR